MLYLCSVEFEDGETSDFQVDAKNDEDALGLAEAIEFWFKQAGFKVVENSLSCIKMEDWKNESLET